MKSEQLLMLAVLGSTRKSWQIVNCVKNPPSLKTFLTEKLLAPKQCVSNMNEYFIPY